MHNTAEIVYREDMKKIMRHSNNTQSKDMPGGVWDAAFLGDYQTLYDYLHHGKEIYGAKPDITRDGPTLLAAALSGYRYQPSEQRKERLLDIAWMLVDAGLDVRVTRGDLARSLGEPAALMNNVRYDARKECPALDIFLKDAVKEGRLTRAAHAHDVSNR